MKVQVRRSTVTTARPTYTWTITQGEYLLAKGEGYADQYSAERAANRAYVALVNPAQLELLPPDDDNAGIIIRQERLIP